LDGTSILQQIQTTTEHPETVTEPTPETAYIYEVHFRQQTK